MGTKPPAKPSLNVATLTAAPTGSVSKKEVVKGGEEKAAQVPEECVNVEGLKISKANKCNMKDKVGMVCFGDRQKHEAYCGLSKDGVKVCARSSARRLSLNLQLASWTHYRMR